MGRSRVLSFLSAFGGPPRVDGGTGGDDSNASTSRSPQPTQKPHAPTSDTPSPPLQPSTTSGTSTPTRWSRNSRPPSMAFTYSPSLMDIAEDTPPELQPIFGFLNSHANKLYHEGYFLKLNDLDTYGRPCHDRQWIECYAQLTGTVLSVWDAAALDAAEQEGQVPPTFINLADASIKMIETLPTRNGEQPLKNILSVSSAGRNRYLLHFNSFHSLIQWTAGIRLAMFEYTSLYEAYTGSIIAGKGKRLNNIRTIMERCRFKYDDWARVRFGAGTPWRRCWFVITPPDDKEIQKLHKAAKKKSAYDRSPRYATGDIKFYDSKKTKKTQPIATIKNVYAAYAVYPQSKALIDQSSLIKLEGEITIHSRPESTTEGFVFVMPEVHPAVSGFEMMLRFLFPTFDTFNLYGRPTRLLADTNNVKSIMFAFPQHRRYGYLDILDVANLIQTAGSQKWSEAEWRKQLKEATARRMSGTDSEASSIAGSRPQNRSSLPLHSGKLRARFSRRLAFSPEGQPDFNQSADAIVETPREEKADPMPAISHHRGNSDMTGLSAPVLPPQGLAQDSPESSDPDLSRQAGGGAAAVSNNYNNNSNNNNNSVVSSRSSSESDRRDEPVVPADALQDHLPPDSPPAPVARPPAFAHGPGQVPASRPQPSPELRMANSRISHTTLAQIAAAGGTMSAAGAAAAWEKGQPQQRPYEQHGPGGMSDQPAQPVEPVQPDSLTAADHEPTGDLEVSRANQPHEAEQPPPVPEHRSDSHTTAGAPPQPLRVDPDRAVRRKPLPLQQPAESHGWIASREPTLEDLRHAVDEEALNRVTTYDASTRSPDYETRTDGASVYDGDSAVSPDYASTHESIHSRQSAVSVQKPRMGVLKTVGAVPKQDLVIGDARYSVDHAVGDQRTSDIPTVDFGPTLSYWPTTGRPSTSDTLKKLDHHRQGSDADRMEDGEPSGARGVPDRYHARGSSKAEARRSMLWQPGVAAARPTSGGVTPEQFVQQRAAGTPPQYVHRRTSSMTPPPARPKSGDWQVHSRSNSGFNSSQEPQPPRPHSRGASSVMNYDEMSSHLSAREQEHVARMTGSSFFNFTSDNSKAQAPVNPMGLVGAIDARERERRAIKDGMSNQMVQHAIAQRQMQLQQQQHQHQNQMLPQPHGSPPGYQYSPSTYGTPSQQHGYSHSLYTLPGANRTWDALNQNQANAADESRRRSWYGSYQPQSTPSPPIHQQSQYMSHHPGYFGNSSNTMYSA